MKKLKRILNVKTIQLRLRCIQGVIRKKREKRNIQGSSMLLKKSKYLNILT